MVSRLFCLFVLFATPALPGPVPFDGGWKKQGFSLFSSNSYALNGSALGVASDGSVSLIWRGLAPQDWSARQARWSWAVREGVPATNLAQKGGDDRNLALYFVFLPRAEAEALQSSGNIRRLLRSDAVRVLIYVWGGDHARGAVLQSPYLGAKGRTVVLRGAGTGQASETVDLARDYARAFGGSPEALVGLAVSADSDDTKSRIRGTISGLQVN